MRGGGGGVAHLSDGHGRGLNLFEVVAPFRGSGRALDRGVEELEELFAKLLPLLEGFQLETWGRERGL